MFARSQLPGRWLDLVVPTVPAAAAGWSAALIAPLFDVMASVAAPTAAVATFLSGWWLMRLASPRPRSFSLQTFQPPEEPGELILEQSDAELGEDVLAPEHQLAGSIDALAELLLDDPLPRPSADSRVVQLFPPQPIPCASELKRRIDVHLGRERFAEGQAGGDATDSLRRALDELRQTLASR